MTVVYTFAALVTLGVLLSAALAYSTRGRP